MASKDGKSLEKCHFSSLRNNKIFRNNANNSYLMWKVTVKTNYTIKLFNILTFLYKL